LTDDLITWLRGQLDEDERVARAVRDQRWVYRRSYDSAAEQTDHVLVIGDRAIGADFGDDPLTPAEAEHIALHDPARVLAEVDAKRRILGWMVDDAGFDLPATKTQAMSSEEWYRVTVARVTIKLLALPYANRDGYREEWRP